MCVCAHVQLTMPSFHGAAIEAEECITHINWQRSWVQLLLGAGLFLLMFLSDVVILFASFPVSHYPIVLVICKQI